MRLWYEYFAFLMLYEKPDNFFLLIKIQTPEEENRKALNTKEGGEYDEWNGSPRAPSLYFRFWQGL